MVQDFTLGCINRTIGPTLMPVFKITTRPISHRENSHPAPITALSHCSAQLADSCKSTALFLYCVLHIHGAFHCTVTVPKVTACFHGCSFLPPLSPYTLFALVQPQSAHNPPDLTRIQGPLIIGPHYLYLHSKQR